MLFRRLKLYVAFIKSLVRVNKGLLRGMWKLTRLPQPAITFFGGTHLPKEDIHSKIICDLAEKLAHAGFSIITGGGPGIMEAANLGAIEHLEEQKKINGIAPHLITVGISLVNLQKKNAYVQDYILEPYFFARKWLLVRYAVGFVVGPGGFGTLNEFTEILTLLQTHQMPNTPVILIGKEYWRPLLEWVHNQAVKNKLIKSSDAQLIHLTDDAHVAFNFITKHCSGKEKCSSLEAPSTERKP